MSQLKRRNKGDVKAQNRRSSRRANGVARRLRFDHGYSLIDSIHLSKQLTDKNECCSICGIVVWWMLLWTGPWPNGGGQRHHLRLQPDHIDPSGSSILSNTRIVCHDCNSFRGAKLRTDEQVLKKVRAFWRWVIPVRFLWWLHTTPGKGGRLHRNWATAARDQRLEEYIGRSHRKTRRPITSSNGQST